MDFATIVLTVLLICFLCKNVNRNTDFNFYDNEII